MISVIICTYNRPNDIGRVVKSVLSNTYPDYELLIIDQSNTDETKKIVEKCITKNSHLKYLWSVRGKSRAVNLGVKEAEGDIIAFTDDDCVVSEDWLEKIAITLDRITTDSIIVFGSVKPAEHDVRRGFIPANKIRYAEFKGPLSIKKVGTGGIMQANMVVRKNFFEKVGYFDEVLGPGGELKAALEYDIVYRALKKGFKIIHVPTIEVEHHGFRTWEEGKLLFERYIIGTVGTFCKHIRCMDFNAVLLLLILIPFDLVVYTNNIISLKFSLLDSLYLLVLIYRIYLISFLKGIIKSMKFNVDKRNMVYLREK
ncbi:MAG TPA: glycosyltransferase family 2 protein [bacterium]|nr:glycosyltransferase family 2 protein [bacterium]